MPRGSTLTQRLGTRVKPAYDAPPNRKSPYHLTINNY
jgi:hypothetical protein